MPSKAYPHPEERPNAGPSRRCRRAAMGCGYRARSDPALQPRRSGAMARPAPGPKRPVDFAASTRWVGQPCGKAAHCSPTTPRTTGAGMLCADCGGLRHKPSASRRRRRDALRLRSRLLVPVARRGRRPGLARPGRCRACGVRRPAPEPRRMCRPAGHDPLRRRARERGRSQYINVPLANVVTDNVSV
jgi:hypothetical protein